jgi:signal peptide peptidase-like 3
MPLSSSAVDLSSLLCVLCGAITAHVSCVRATRAGCTRVQIVPSCACAACAAQAAPLPAHIVLVLPVAAAGLLLALFFFRTALGTALVAFYAVAGVVAVAYTVWPALGDAQLHLATGSTIAAALCAAAAFVTCWLFTGHWILANVIAMSMCILVVSLCKVPSFNVVLALLAAMFVYDIFFVFLSERLFGENVMVQVATSESRNPVSMLSDALHLPISPIKLLSFPDKIIFPSTVRGAPDGAYALLGLGDIVIPSMLLAYLRTCDMRICASLQTPIVYFYYVRAMLAFVCAMISCIVVNILSDEAQPALMYIVPALLVPTLLLARARNEFDVIWHGPIQFSDPIVESGERQLLRVEAQSNENSNTC